MKQIIIGLFLIGIVVTVYSYLSDGSGGDSPSKEINSKVDEKNLVTSTLNESIKETNASIKLGSIPQNPKQIAVHVEHLDQQVEAALEVVKKQQEKNEVLDTELDNEIAELDELLEESNAKANIDGEAIKAEIDEILDTPLALEDIPEELAKSMEQTDKQLLELEEKFDQFKEEMSNE